MSPFAFKMSLPAVAGILLFLPPATIAQNSISKPAPTAKPVARKKMAVDPVIAQALKEISSARIQQTIEKLVSFYTRATLSVNNPDAATSDKGIVAARNWIKSEFERYSADCGGCLEVKTDTFIEQPQGAKDRITQPTEIQNVYAILRGTDPQQQKRIYLVTGHYDSRNSDPINGTNQAPGANR